MAHRDRSQGFGFMYVNIAKVLEEQKQVSAESSIPVLTQNVHQVNFNKDKGPMVAPSATAPAVTSDTKNKAIAQIRENLDRLQTLHHKLHAMLDELNKISTTKRKP